MKKTISVLLAVATVAGSLVSITSTANARDGDIAAGLIGGALIGGAIAASRPPVYVAPEPVYVDEGPACRMVRERYWDGYGYRTRRMRVCD